MGQQTSPFLGEVRIMSFNFAPSGWAMCNGQLLSINQNQALFSLLGTTYGGDGQTTFALPNLQGRVPIHFDGGHPLGERAGEQSHTLAISELPTHTHIPQASPTNGDSPVPTGRFLGPGGNLYSVGVNLTTLLPATVGNVGGSQAHENMQPYLTLNFCIALVGIFPSRD